MLKHPPTAQLAQCRVMHSEHSNGSEWPHRRERRQAAAARDVGRLEARLVSIEASMRELGAQVGTAFGLMKVQPAAVHVPPGFDSARPADEVGEVRRRLEKVELLLFRTSLLEWHALDKEIVALLPMLVPATPQKEEGEGEGETTVLTAASCGRKLQRQDDSWASTIASATDFGVVKAEVKQVAETEFFNLAQDDDCVTSEEVEEDVESEASVESIDAEYGVGSADTVHEGVKIVEIDIEGEVLGEGATAGLEVGACICDEVDGCVAVVEDTEAVLGALLYPKKIKVGRHGTIDVSGKRRYTPDHDEKVKDQDGDSEVLSTLGVEIVDDGGPLDVLECGEVEGARDAIGPVVEDVSATAGHEGEADAPVLCEGDSVAIVTEAMFGASLNPMTGMAGRHASGDDAGLSSSTSCDGPEMKELGGEADGFTRDSSTAQQALRAVGKPNRAQRARRQAAQDAEGDALRDDADTVMRRSAQLLQRGGGDAARLRCLRNLIAAQVALARKADRALLAAKSEADTACARAALADCERAIRVSVDKLCVQVAAGA